MKKTLLTIVFALAISIFLMITVSAEDNNFYKNGSDFVEINGGEFYSNIDDQDKLYYFDKTTQSHTKVLDEHIITMVDIEDTIYLISYVDGKSKLLEFSTTDNFVKEIALLNGIANNVCIRDSILYYILDGNIYEYNLLNNDTNIVVEGGNIDLCYFKEYNSLTYYSKNLNGDYDKKHYDFTNKVNQTELSEEISLFSVQSSDSISLMAATSYTPRLTAPSTSDPYYTSLNVFHTSGYGMVGNNGNCTCYAYGRSYENLGYKPSLSTGNAENWYNYNKNNGYYSYGKTPHLGAVAVWGKGVIGNSSDGAGHVAVVEVIDGDTVTTSESGWKSFYFKTYTRSASHSNFSYSSSYSFQGFIYVMGQIASESSFFDFWDTGDNITISGTYKFWWKQTGYGNCDVNMDINGTPIGTLYQDANGYFSYEFDSTKYANGTYTFGAIIRSTSGAEKYVTRTININNTANNPTSAVDICEGVDGGLHIRGWAFDKDNTNETIQVHVYIGGPAGSGEGHVIYANTYRSDVNDVYGVGSNHGFDAIISTALKGKQNVYIYIINIGAGQNVLHTRENINIPDLHAPTIENITVTNRSSSGYTVTCTFKDDVGLSYVTFPTWTPNNGQDDITWDRVELSGKEQTVSYTVKIDKHNNEKAVYYTDIYVYDTSNNSKWGHSSCYVESNPPVISDVKITDISSKGYTVICSVNDAENEISKVLFPTWSDYNGQDDLAYDWPNNPSIVGTVKDGIATFRVNTSEHNNNTGLYNTHIYAYDSCGNIKQYNLQVEVGEPYTEFNVKDDGEKDIFTINCHCMEKGNTVILALYKENRFVKMYNSIYEGETIPFEVTEDYDSVKVMVWSDFETLSPVCEANSTPTIIE